MSIKLSSVVSPPSPAAVPRANQLALGVAIGENALSAATVRAQPLRVTGFCRAGLDEAGRWESADLLKTLRRKLNIESDVVAVIVVDEEQPRWMAGDDGMRSAVALSALSELVSDVPGGSPQVLVPPDLVDQLESRLDLPAIAVAAAYLAGHLVVNSPMSQPGRAPVRI